MASARQLLLTMGWFALCHSVTAAELNDEPAVEGATPSTTTVLYTYDALGRLIYVVNPVAGDRDYRYDDAGNRTSVATDGNAHNQQPTANEDSLMMLLHETRLLDLVQNDSDPNGDMLSIVAITQPTNATVSIEADGRHVSIHATSAVSDQAFSYTISDGFGGEDSATVSLTVTLPSPEIVTPVYFPAAGTPQIVSWIGVGGADTEYDIYAIPAGGGAPDAGTTPTEDELNSTQWTHPAREAEAESHVWVRACRNGDAGTCSIWAGPIEIIWVLQPPDPGVQLSPVAVADAATGSIDISWNSHPEAEHYDVYWWSTGGLPPQPNATVQAPAQSVNTGSLPDGTYTVRVEACNSTDCGASAQTSVSLQTPLPAPVFSRTWYPAFYDVNVTVSWNLIDGAVGYFLYNGDQFASAPSEQGAIWRDGAATTSWTEAHTADRRIWVRACRSNSHADCGAWSAMAEIVVNIRSPAEESEGEVQ